MCSLTIECVLFLYRHPTRISWVVETLFDQFPPYHSDSNSTLVCRRIALLKPIVNELSWRGGPLHRQFLHDVEPYLSSPFTQTRDYASSAVSLIARVTWGPAWSQLAPDGANDMLGGDGGGGGGGGKASGESGESAEKNPVSPVRSPGSAEKSPVSARQSPACRRPSSHWGITKGAQGAVSPASYQAPLVWIYMFF